MQRPDPVFVHCGRGRAVCVQRLGWVVRGREARRRPASSAAGAGADAGAGAGVDVGLLGSVQLMYQTPDDSHDIQTSRVITLGADSADRGVEEGGVDR